MIEIKILSARNPQWASEDHKHIDCLVKTNTLINEVPFTASESDVEPHGRELFAQCVAGEFGPIAPMQSRDIPAIPPHNELPEEYNRWASFLLVANQENSRKSSRSIVIVWASLVDGLLDEILEREASRGRFEDRPPATFDARIRAAKANGVIDDATADRLNHVRVVRNAAAHEWQLSLQTEKVLPSLRALYDADHSTVLIFHEDLDFLIQHVYSASCAMLADELMRITSRE